MWGVEPANLEFVRWEGEEVVEPEPEQQPETEDNHDTDVEPADNHDTGVEVVDETLVDEGANTKGTLLVAVDELLNNQKDLFS